MTDPTRPDGELASRDLQARIAQVGALAEQAAQEATPTAPRPPAPSGSGSRRIVLAVAAIGAVAASAQAMRARHVPLDVAEVRRGLELQATQVRVELLRSGQMPTLEQAGRVDPRYVLVPLDPYSFRVQLAVPPDTFAVEGWADAREFIWIPAKGRSAR